ncbi:MAG: ABC transporter permease [Spirochaetia bacterium]|jgi:simple sugar transport system permease protein
MNNFLDLGLISAAVRIGAPLLFAALGTVFVSSAGVMNISIEGSMLVGTFTAVVIGYLTQSVLLGFLAAGVAGLLLAAAPSLLIVKLRGDPIVVGLGGNLLAWGITVFLLEEVLHMRGTFTGSPVPFFKPLSIPGVNLVPVLKELLSGYTTPIYLSVIVALLIGVVLYKTPSGLIIRSTGANSEAVRAIGTDVPSIQIACFLLSGFLAGLGGACLSVANLQGFWSENMTNGRGYIALCAAAFGRNNPKLVMLACFLFGLAEAIGIRTQVFHLPPAFVLMIPYILTIVMLTVSTKRERI